MKAIWNGQVVAQSDDTVVVESNHYFPRESLVSDYFTASSKSTHCPWKGDANYLSITVDERTNEDAAWFYATPKDAAKNIAGRVAFWRGVEVVA
tara:strand:+ start:194807 stop:195088 length:282 start_codon:yes stop_codon:yes gene_type:complete